MERAKREVRPVSYREMTADEQNVDLVAPSSRARERPERRTGKESPLDSLAGNGFDVPGAPGLCCSLGGEGTGGQEAERILREVEIDDDAIQLRGQFANCRRVLLAQGSRGLAAAVVELKAHEKVFEIPILASARNQRQQGHGSVLVALLFEMAASLGATMVVVSATMESRRFWMTQACRPALVEAASPHALEPAPPLDDTGVPHALARRAVGRRRDARAQPKGRALRLLPNHADGAAAARGRRLRHARRRRARARRRPAAALARHRCRGGGARSGLRGAGAWREAAQQGQSARWQRPSAAPAPPHGAPGGSGRLGIHREGGDGGAGAGRALVPCRSR